VGFQDTGWFREVLSQCRCLCNERSAEAACVYSMYVLRTQVADDQPSHTVPNGGPYPEDSRTCIRRRVQDLVPSRHLQCIIPRLHTDGG
jgi:hypothetical protein